MMFRTPINKYVTEKVSTISRSSNSFTRSYAKKFTYFDDYNAYIKKYREMSNEDFENAWNKMSSGEKGKLFLMGLSHKLIPPLALLSAQALIMMGVTYHRQTVEKKSAANWEQADAINQPESYKPR